MKRAGFIAALFSALVVVGTIPARADTTHYQNGWCYEVKNFSDALTDFDHKYFYWEVAGVGSWSEVKAASNAARRARTAALSAIRRESDPASRALAPRYQIWVYGRHSSKWPRATWVSAAQYVDREIPLRCGFIHEPQPYPFL